MESCGRRAQLTKKCYRFLSLHTSHTSLMSGLLVDNLEAKPRGINEELLQKLEVMFSDDVLAVFEVVLS